LNIRRELVSVLFISALAFVPGLFISGFLENLLNSGEPSALTSLLTLVIAGVIALPLFIGIGFGLKVSSIISASDSLKRKIAKR
jgi:ABC-type bacteriocin/lantibiotic exporter with double-glycine peptidase domain